MMVLDVRLEVVGQPFIRAVSKAICTSGEPVSPAARWCCRTICAFSVTLTRMLSLLSLRERPAFYLEISTFNKQF